MPKMPFFQNPHGVILPGVCNTRESGRPAVDHGNIVGNVYDKYGTKNPIARLLMSGFLRAVSDLYRRTQSTSVLEVGCGEGHLASALIRQHAPAEFVACDVDDRERPGVDPRIRFDTASIYGLPYADNAFELVVCCEVLEHLERPEQGLRELARVAANYVLISTPWEPVWRAMNLARGRYIRDLGNTPGHIQHFGRRALIALASQQMHVQHVRRPLPWTVILGAPRS